MVLLSGCASSPPAACAPQALTAPPSTADIRKAEQHEYWAGYAAGRHYQKLQDAQSAAPAPDAPPPVVAATGAAQAVSVPAPVPVQPAPPAVDSYAPKGPALPVATPVN